MRMNDPSRNLSLTWQAKLRELLCGARSYEPVAISAVDLVLKRHVEEAHPAHACR